MRNRSPYPPYHRVLIDPKPMRLVDGIVVRLSSIMIVGSVLWGPFIAYSFLKRIMKKYKVDPTARKRILIAGAFASLVIIFGPHRKRKVGEWLNVRNWKLWDSWMRFVSYTVIQDLGDKEDDEGFSVDLWTEQAILSIIPHGIFPFGLGLAALPADAVRAFGLFRVVIASATNLFPIVSTVCSWLGAVDASKSSVNSALAAGDSIGLAPGGIAEMFEGYPKVGCEPNDEVALLMKRKGFVKMAIQHGLPIIPCYTFGATKMFKRLDLPLLEKISNFLRISLCIFFGKFGLPMPFRQHLLYVIGRPIFPPSLVENKQDVNVIVDDMHQKFIVELVRIFNKYKHSYGWGHKRIVLK